MEHKIEVTYIKGNSYQYKILNKNGVVLASCGSWPSAYIAEIQAKIYLRNLEKKKWN